MQELPFSIGRLLGLDLVKSLIIIGAERTHPTIPPQKIKPIATLKKLVMKIMIHWCIDPSTQPTFWKSCWIQFVSKMTFLNHVKDQKRDSPNNQLPRKNQRKNDPKTISWYFIVKSISNSHREEGWAEFLKIPAEETRLSPKKVMQPNSFLFNSPRPIFSAKGYNVIKFSIAWVNWEKNLQEEQLESKKKSEPKKNPGSTQS